MTCNEMYSISFEDIEKFLSIGPTFNDLSIEGKRVVAFRIEDLGMSRNYQRSRFVHIGKVLQKPIQLVRGKVLLIIPGLCTIIIRTVNVIQHDKMNLADII